MIISILILIKKYFKKIIKKFVFYKIGLYICTILINTQKITIMRETTKQIIIALILVIICIMAENINNL